MLNDNGKIDMSLTMAAKPANLKINNRKAVLDILRKEGLMTVTDIAEKTGLSRTTAMKTINFLLLSGYAVSAGKGESTLEGGKKPELFRFDAGVGYAYCVTLLPTFIEGALLDMDANIIDRCKIGHAPDSSIDTVTDNIALAFRLLREKNDVSASNVLTVAVGCDGIVNADNGEVYGNPHFPSWKNGLNISEIVGKKLGGGRTVLTDNNVRYMAYADLDRLTLEQKKDVTTLMADYGVGGCVLHNGQILCGAHHEQGEFGHQIVSPFDDEVCRCGNKGCFESMIIEKRVIKEAARIYASDREYSSSRIASKIENGSLTLPEIFNAADAGDAFARSVLDWVINWFTVEIHNIQISNDPRVVMIYGVYASAGEYFYTKLKERVDATHFGGKGTDVDIMTTDYDTQTAIITGAGKYAIGLYFSSDATYSD